MRIDYSLIHSSIEREIKKRHLIQKDERILIALSGGQDSLCLTKVLIDLSSRWSWKLLVAHCDHGWSSDQGIAEHVESLVKAWNLPFYLQKSQDALPEKEEAARNWRYQILQEIASREKCSTIVTGHTQSDRAETLLYNLIRGSGSSGLASLNWLRMLPNGSKLVRPMLNISRSDTERFCNYFGLAIWQDAVNQKLEYARNRLRLEVIPYLMDHFNPQVEQQLSQTGEILKAEDEYLNSLVEPLINQMIEGVSLERKALKNLPLALQRRVIRYYLSQVLLKMPNFEQIEETINLLSAPNGSKTSTFAGKAVLQVQGNWIIVKY